MNQQPIFSKQDLEKAEACGLGQKDLEDQVNTLREGFSPIQAVRPCKVNDGIRAFSEEQVKTYHNLFREAQFLGRFSKMVPASGAATRMFKFVFNMVMEPQKPNPDFDRLVAHLSSYPFFDSIPEPVRNSSNQHLAKFLLEDLGFGSCPKAYIPFHRYADEIRTPLDEHFEDSKQYLGDADQTIRLHFTIDPEFESKFQSASAPYRQSKEWNFDVSHSVQKASTQTLALDENGLPVRTPEGDILLRPGGHGSLLENLQDLEGDLVFIQNIDNVGRQEHHIERTKYKKLLGGYLVYIQKQIRYFYDKLASGQVELQTVWAFCKKHLGLEATSETLSTSHEQQAEVLKRILNRPTRVCGMVKNEGEPGGGPFWIQGDNRFCQILEKAQLNLDDAKQQNIFDQSTHFNPVDLVCGLKDIEGKRFNLSLFKDPKTCFISAKSYNGHTIKALEHPGLWNGAMAFWNTAFVEVPLMTFTPVKTVNDLLRPSHQPST